MKKIKFIIVIVIFLLSFLFHFMYNWVPCFITSIFFPVNESIWEHMKILSGSILVGSLIEYFIYKYKNIYVSNLLFSSVFISIVSVIIYLLIYLPLYSIFKENMFISISLMFITYVIVEYISYKILLYKTITVNKYVLLTVIVIIYSIYGYLTYKPIKNYIFYDIKDNKYGVDIYY